jgi:hypothetical protein
MQGLDKVIGKTSMNPEIVHQLKINTKEVLEMKYDISIL